MDDIQAKATIAEVENQRNWALMRCIEYAMEMAALQAMVKAQAGELEKLRPKESTDGVK